MSVHSLHLIIAFCLVADKLGEVNDRLVQSPYVAALEVSLPGTVERERYCEHVDRQEGFAKLTEFAPKQLAESSSCAAARRASSIPPH